MLDFIQKFTYVDFDILSVFDYYDLRKLKLGITMAFRSVEYEIVFLYNNRNLYFLFRSKAQRSIDIPVKIFDKWLFSKVWSNVQPQIRPADVSKLRYATWCQMADNLLVVFSFLVDSCLVQAIFTFFCIKFSLNYVTSKDDFHFVLCVGRKLLSAFLAQQTIGVCQPHRDWQILWLIRISLNL